MYVSIYSMILKLSTVWNHAFLKTSSESKFANITKGDRLWFHELWFKLLYIVDQTHLTHFNQLFRSWNPVKFSWRERFIFQIYNKNCLWIKILFSDKFPDITACQIPTESIYEAVANVMVQILCGSCDSHELQFLSIGSFSLHLTIQHLFVCFF